MGFSRATFRFCKFLLQAQEVPRQEKSGLRSRNIDDLSVLTLVFNIKMNMEKSSR